MRTRQLKGKVVVVTGASSGVGRATAKEFTKSGARLALIARSEEQLDDTIAELRQLRAGAEAIAIPIDVADADAVEQAADRVERELGPIDIWVNDAMATIFARADKIEPDELKRTTEVTYLGAAYGTITALRRMRERDAGVIVQVGSAVSYRAIPLQAAYSGAKFALRGFTDAVRCELLHDRSSVRITMVHLPAVNTPQFGWVRNRLPLMPRPVAPTYQPEIPARAIVHAAAHPRREYWVGGSTVATILGTRVSPSLLDRYLARNAVEGQQQQDHPVPPGHKDYLFSPVAIDPGTHGMFDGEAKSVSVQSRMNLHRGEIAAASLAALGAAGAVAMAKRQ
jgi:NAD(P)-dependent dehydrogenase (short-subunit alcohol dehydrogenase family)